MPSVMSQERQQEQEQIIRDAESASERLRKGVEQLKATMKETQKLRLHLTESDEQAEPTP